MDLLKESNRYSRQIPVIGHEGQQQLQHARVLCVGAGGLGCPALLYLNAAGVGTLGIVDGDCVELSNLQRQILFTESDIGKPKAHVARERCLQQNSSTQLTSYAEYLNATNGQKLLKDYDIILDATDNFDTRYIINHLCRQLKKPLISASILKYEAQIGIFNYQEGPCYQCLYPEPPTTIGNCAETGVLGVAPGIAGTLQACETIKLILRQGEILSGKILTVNLLTLSFKKFKLPRHRNCQHRCKFTTMQLPQPITTINIEQLVKLQANSTVQLIDVREPTEHTEFNIGGINIPLAMLTQKLSQLDKQQQTVLYCYSGQRSAQACKLLLKHGFINVQHLKGGIAKLHHKHLPLSL